MVVFVCRSCKCVKWGRAKPVKLVLHHTMKDLHCEVGQLMWYLINTVNIWQKLHLQTSPQADHTEGWWPEIDFTNTNGKFICLAESWHFPWWPTDPHLYFQAFHLCTGSSTATMKTRLGSFCISVSGSGSPCLKKPLHIYREVSLSHYQNKGICLWMQTTSTCNMVVDKTHFF